MKSSAATPQAYLAELPDDRKKAMSDLRNVILKNIPEGFKEEMSYGMIGYVVPHSLYPKGYHCNPKLPLPLVNIASQKNFIALYHMCVYSNPELLKWFENEYAQRVPHKLDMGKGCIRFKKIDQIPLELIGELAAKITPQAWITEYEKLYLKK